MTAHLVAGIDAGTQSLKVVVYDPQAKAMVASASVPLELTSAAGGVREQHASAWVEAMHACFAQIDAGVRAQIGALAVSGQQHGFVPLGADGQVLAPVKLWCDTSSAEQCTQIMDAVGGLQACIDLAGNPILAGYTASKLPWTRSHRPEAYAALDCILLPHDYLNFVLTGERFMEAGDASGTGWMDVRTRQWSPALLRAIDPQRDLAACLPPLVDAGTTFALAPAMAQALGLPLEAVVAVGGGDNMMAAIGTGCVAPGRLAMSLGTSGTLFAHSDVPVVDPQGRWAAFCSSSGGWLPLICTMNCTVATQTVATLLGFDTRQGDARIEASAPGADGVVMLPFLNGERTPDLPLGTGTVAGLTPANAGQANLYRAAMEGATYSIRYGFDAFVDAGMAFDHIVLTGGGANSAAWRQMVADVFNLPVQVPRQAEGAAFGAALQALWVLQRRDQPALELSAITDAHVVMNPAQSATPDPGRVTAYATAYSRYLDHLQAMSPLWSPTHSLKQEKPR